MLGKKATLVFTGTDGMEKFFPAGKIIVTGNPVRASIAGSTKNRSDAARYFSLDESKQIVLIVGGSLGARTINEAIDRDINSLTAAGLQLIWQTGKLFTSKNSSEKGLWVNAFITEMEYAYAAADIVVSRSGAMSVAELCVAKKPVVFVPYPFAAEDHQTVNARKLVDQQAALMVTDAEASAKLVPMILDLAKDTSRQEQLRKNIGALAVIDADKKIAEHILKNIG
jgi:UDP-N-acetylglucosamine--N-acetylmuramyl-(pentapeptide) pyrophosphoryl-undecaprenol N-acetylglucosamine transferase